MLQQQAEHLMLEDWQVIPTNQQQQWAEH